MGVRGVCVADLGLACSQAVEHCASWSSDNLVTHPDSPTRRCCAAEADHSSQITALYETAVQECKWVAKLLGWSCTQYFVREPQPMLPTHARQDRTYKDVSEGRPDSPSVENTS